MMKQMAKNYARYSIFLVGYNLFVILWGAFVRASGSGAGCGAHWPLCNGEVIPQAPQIATVIEFVHRITSGLTLVFVVILVIWTWKITAQKSLHRWSAGLSGILTLTEALIGAALVLFQLVAQDTSAARAASISAHLINTFLLLAVLSLNAFWAVVGAPKKLLWPGRRGWIIVLGIVGTILIGVSGAITALGDTLFPSGSLIEGFQQDLSPTVNFLLRLRVIHPVLAILVGFYLIRISVWIMSNSGKKITSRIAAILIGTVITQVALGGINVILLAPIWMQIIHLLVSNSVWISLVLLTGLILTTDNLTPASPQGL